MLRQRPFMDDLEMLLWDDNHELRGVEGRPRGASAKLLTVDKSDVSGKVRQFLRGAVESDPVARPRLHRQPPAELIAAIPCHLLREIDSADEWPSDRNYEQGN